MLFDDPDRYFAPTSNAYYQQGDVLVAPVAIVDDQPEGQAHEGLAFGQGVRRSFWTDEPFGKPATGEASCVPAMILTHDCSLDKEFNRRYQQLRTQGRTKSDAVAEAASDSSLDRLMTIAPIVPVLDANPSDPTMLHQNRVIGFFPICESSERGIDQGVVDLSRQATIDKATIIDRCGILSADARAALLYALARYWAFRAPKLTYEIEMAIGKRIVDATVTSGGDLGVVLSLDDDTTLRLLQAPDDPGGGVERPSV